MGGVKIREATVEARIRRVRVRGGACAETRTYIDRFCERVSDPEVLAGLHPSVGSNLQLIAGGTAVADVCNDLSCALRDEVYIAIGQRPGAIGRDAIYYIDGIQRIGRRNITLVLSKQVVRVATRKF